jgi:alkanesulfonate monooxygenase SsuD/methylene tetrahydromethanopterin reductase-like flavin-dependent oxidoreductase (luciferase family)
VFTVLDDDWERARAQAARQLGRQYNQPFEDLARKYCLLGPPAACLEQLDRFVTAGARTFVIYFTVPPERILEQLERFGTEVLPHVPDRAGFAAPPSAAWRT